MYLNCTVCVKDEALLSLSITEKNKDKLKISSWKTTLFKIKVQSNYIAQPLCHLNEESRSDDEINQSLILFFREQGKFVIMLTWLIIDKVNLLQLYMLHTLYPKL